MPQNLTVRQIKLNFILIHYIFLETQLSWHNVLQDSENTQTSYATQTMHNAATKNIHMDHKNKCYID